MFVLLLVKYPMKHWTGLMKLMLTGEEEKLLPLRANLPTNLFNPVLIVACMGEVVGGGLLAGFYYTQEVGRAFYRMK